jgi:hypothetical protein
MICEPNVSITPFLRAEGYTELIGDVTLSCTGGSPTASGVEVPTADIQITLNTAVTSRIYPSGLSEALLLVDEPGPGLPGASNTHTQLPCADAAGRCTISGTGTGAGTYDGSAGRPNIFFGTVSGNIVTFYGVPIDPASQGSARVFRFTNIRVNAKTLSNGSDAIRVFASPAILNSSQSILLQDATRYVGDVTPGLSISGRSPDNSSAGTVSQIASCFTPQRAGVLRFSELTTNALMPRTAATFVNGDTSPSPLVQNLPGTFYYTPGLWAGYSHESAFYNPALSSPAVDFATVGLASFATRVQATIDMRSGARVWVSLRNVTYSGGNPIPAASGTVARLVTNATGPFSPASPTTILEGVPAFELVAAPGNAFATATWEVLDANLIGLDNFDFVVWVQGGASAGTVGFNAGYAPSPASQSDAAAFGAASSALPIPRFLAASPVIGLFTTVACQIPTTTVISTSASNISSGTPITLAARVGSSGGTPIGTVSFFDSATSTQSSIASANLVNGTGSVVLTPTPGVHTYIAYYAATSTYAQSISTGVTVTVTVVQATRINPTIALASSNSPSIAGQSVTFTASVSGGSSVPTGTIRFVDGAQTLGTASLSGGQARITITPTGARTHDIFAFYSGDSAYSDASERFGQVVNAVTGTLTLSANPMSATNGQAIVFAAQLSTPPAGAPAATGTVQFLEGAVLLGTASLANGAASLSNAALTAGSHRIVAAFSGDGNWYSIRSQSVIVTVTNAVSQTMLAVVFTSARTTLSATVTGSGSAVPSGTVEFTDTSSGLVLGRGPLAGGAASISLAAGDALPLAGHSVVASYSGSESLLPGSSNTVVLVAMINAAGNLSTTFAPDEIATILGAGFGEASQQANDTRLPESLGGIALTVTDSAGQTRNSGLSYVSSAQVNVVLPCRSCIWRSSLHSHERRHCHLHRECDDCASRPRYIYAIRRRPWTGRRGDLARRRKPVLGVVWYRYSQSDLRGRCHLLPRRPSGTGAVREGAG